MDEVLVFGGAAAHPHDGVCITSWREDIIEPVNSRSLVLAEAGAHPNTGLLGIRNMMDIHRISYTKHPAQIGRVEGCVHHILEGGANHWGVGFIQRISYTRYE